jgi:two-component system, response regulator PdtaR
MFDFERTSGPPARCPHAHQERRGHADRIDWTGGRGPPRRRARLARRLPLHRAAGACAVRVLIVEDEALIAMALADSLEDGGHEVMGPAATMAEALALCEAAPPELALLDINLRDGSNGVDVARALLARWGVLSIFASGQMMEARRARDVALGYIRKPYETETVLRSVEVAREVMSGAAPGAVPAGFEPFFKAG